MFLFEITSSDSSPCEKYRHTSDKFRHLQRPILHIHDTLCQSRKSVEAALGKHFALVDDRKLVSQKRDHYTRPLFGYQCKSAVMVERNKVASDRYSLGTWAAIKAC